MPLARALVHVHDPEGDGDVGGVEHVARQDDDRLHTVILDEPLAVLVLVGVAECAVREEESRDAVRGSEL